MRGHCGLGQDGQTLLQLIVGDDQRKQVTEDVVVHAAGNGDHTV